MRVCVCLAITCYSYGKMWNHGFIPSGEGIHVFVVFFNFLSLFTFFFFCLYLSFSSLSLIHPRSHMCPHNHILLHKHMEKRRGKWWCVVIIICFGLKSIQGDLRFCYLRCSCSVLSAGRGASLPMTLFFLNNFTNICCSRSIFIPA